MSLESRDLGVTRQGKKYGTTVCTTTEAVNMANLLLIVKSDEDAVRPEVREELVG